MITIFDSRESLEEYSALKKAEHNAAYMEKIDKAIERLANGGGTVHELIEADDA